MSSPIVKNGRVTGFYDGWVANRRFPVDMAGFAVSVKMILNVSFSQVPATNNCFKKGFHWMTFSFIYRTIKGPCRSHLDMKRMAFYVI